MTPVGKDLIDSAKEALEYAKRNTIKSIFAKELLEWIEEVKYNDVYHKVYYPYDIPPKEMYRIDYEALVEKIMELTGNKDD